MTIVMVWERFGNPGSDPARICKKHTKSKGLISSMSTNKCQVSIPEFENSVKTIHELYIGRNVVS